MKTIAVFTFISCYILVTNGKPLASFSPLIYLKHYGYYTSNNHYSRNDLASAIKRFQSFAGLPKTDRLLDSDTLKLMKRPRCGLKDYSIATYSYSADTPLRWHRQLITYYIDSYPSLISPNRTTEIIQKAFKFWSDVTPLRFQQIHTNKAAIIIKFISGDHGDPYPFDGIGNTLAHAFPPPNGDTHFDNAEVFSDNGNVGVDLLWVATHEFGHALGLDHSKLKSSIMHPIYGGFRPNMMLDNEDVMNIQKLYGKKTSTKTNPLTVAATVCKDNYNERTCRAWKASSYCGSEVVMKYCQKTCGKCQNVSK